MSVQVVADRVERVDPRTLVELPDNPRRGDVDALVRSLTAFGQRRPLIVRRVDRVVLSGNHTLRAALRCDMPDVAIVFVDDDEITAKAWALADNHTADLGTYDETDLANMLRDVAVDDDLLAATSYSLDDLAALLDAADVDDVDVDEDEDTADRGPRSFDVFDREQIVDACFAHYRSTGWPDLSVPRHVAMLSLNRLAATSDAHLVRSRQCYAVADAFHPHRFDAHALGRVSPRVSFDDDHRLRIAIELLLDSHTSMTDRTLLGVVSLSRGAQAASNFRPGFALHLLRRFAPDAACVLDSSTGYGGRLLAFIASHCSTYIGVDPSSLTHAANERIVESLCPSSKRVELLCMPAEDVPHDLVRGRCDFAFTSPPYFAKEVYSDESTQSAARYAKPEQWRDGFLRPMLALQFAALRDGSTNVVNIADVNVRNRDVPLVEWTCAAAADVGFVVERIEEFPMTRRLGASQADEVATEPVIVMRKT